MKLLFIILAVFLNFGCAYSMDEEEAGVMLTVLHTVFPDEVMRKARHVVRPVVLETLETYVAKNKNLSEGWVGFKWEFNHQDYSGVLNRHILEYLKTENDPALLGCNYSFERVRDALMREGIRLDEKNQDKLRLLTSGEQHAEVINGARAIVRSIVYTNVQRFLKNKNLKNAIEKLEQSYNDIDDLYIIELDKDIVQYLTNGQDPIYLGCNFSFKGVKEELRKSEIVLNEQTGTLRFLTEREKRRNKEECQKLYDEFEAI
ncbi:MAG: hypothetical protein K2W92_07315 [Alphaproteobacteria bacterium]|nr:hypothetical protein [Alphaproteobacteria bacterium]